MATVQPANAIGTLVIRLYRAEKLKDKDLTGGLQNPFATLALEPLGSQKQESNVVKDGSTNPVFDQRFVFKLEGKEAVLDFHMYHKGGVLTRSIGSVKIPIETLIQAPDLSWYSLEHDRGMVMLQSQFRGALKGTSIDTFDDGTISFLQALLFPPVTATLDAEPLPLGPGMAVATANPPALSAVDGIVYESLSSCPMLDAVGTMVIEIIRCENLKDMNWTASDQSVFFFLQLEPMRSQNHMGDVLRHVGTEGMVDQRYKFILDGQENVLNLFVYKRGGILNRRIGKVHLPLVLLLKNDQPQWFALESGNGLIQMRTFYRGALNGQQVDTFDVSLQTGFDDLPLPTSLPPYIPFAQTDADRVPPSARAVGQLVLHLQRAEDLVDKTWTGSHQNPYAKLQFNTNTANAIRTRAIKDGGKTPVFDERYVFELNGNESQFEVFIYHYSDFIDREIGHAYIPVEQLLSCFIPTWFPLANENGRVLLTAQFKGTFRDQLFDSFDESAVQFLMEHAQIQLSQAIPPAAVGTDVVDVDEKANAATLPIMTSASAPASSASAVGAAMQAAEQPLPAAAVGELVIHVVRARNLKDKTWTGGDQNPYVVVSLSPSKQRNRGGVVEKGGHDPTFDQKLLFVLEGQEVWLDVTIMHRSPFIDRKIGRARLHLDRLLTLDTPRWIELDGGGGDVELCAQFRGTWHGNPFNTFDPETIDAIPGLTSDWNKLAAAGWLEQTRDLPFAEANGVMVLHVVKAEHLKDKDWSGNEQFPYILVWVDPYDLQRQQSPPIKFGGINPTFDQRFLLRLAGSETSVKVQLFHQAVLADRRIGAITFPVDELLMHSQPQWFYLDDDGGAIQVAARFRGTVRGRSVDTLAAADLEAFPALQASQAASPMQLPDATATAAAGESPQPSALAATGRSVPASSTEASTHESMGAFDATPTKSSDASLLTSPPGAPPATAPATQTLGGSEKPREMVFDGGEVSGTRAASMHS